MSKRSKAPDKNSQTNRMMRLRGSLTARVASALVLVGSLAVFVTWGEVVPHEKGFMPIKKVHVEGVFKHTSAEQLQNKIADYSSGGFFNVDVSIIEEVARQMDWIRSASVRRVWPDTLQVIIVEQEPLLVWNTKALINKQGELFHPQEKNIPSGLPALTGPQGLHAMVLSHYEQMTEKLSGLEQDILTMDMDDRHALQVSLRSGINLMIGRSNVDEALDRFIDVLKSPYAETFSKNRKEIAHVDLRYTNGFAVRWKSRQVSTEQVESGSWRGES